MLADRDLHHDWRMGVAQEQGAGRAQQARALAALRADGTTVRFRHVRAHAGHGMNERADRLAAQVTQCAHEGMRSRDTHLSTFRPTEVGRRGHGSGVYAPPAAGRVTSRWIRCRTEGQRRGGGEMGEEGGKTRG